jgi:hypothetical protein
LLFPASCSLSAVNLHLKTMSPMTQRKTNYQRLRSDYDLAFHQLALELQNLTQPEAQKNIEISAAYRCYLRRRNDLANYLLSRRAKAHVAPAAIPNDFWGKSGRPVNDRANWYDAGAQCS